MLTPLSSLFSESLSHKIPRCLLAFDCATAQRSVAVWQAGNTLALRTETATQGEAQRLLPLIEATLDQAGLTYKDFDGVAVTIGPGSFTGLRVGLATARGICLAAAKPLIGVTTLEALAAECPQPLVLATVDSRRRDPFIQIFHRQDATVPSQPATEPIECTLELIASVVRSIADTTVTVVGDRAQDVTELLQKDGIDARLSPPISPSAEMVAQLAVTRWATARSPEDLMTMPLYLRPADAVPARTGGKLRP